jgi:hypothetical protein
MAQHEAQPRLSIHIADDKESVVINFLPASGVAGSLQLTLDQLTGLISGLGSVRQQLLSGKPEPPLEGQQLNAISSTQWYIQPEPLSEGSLLVFSHPAFGPVGFVVPKDQVSEIVRLLTVHLGIQHASTGKPN